MGRGCQDKSLGRRVAIEVKFGGVATGRYRLLFDGAGKSVTCGVKRGSVAVGPPVLLMTLLISPFLPRATVIMSWKRMPGLSGTSMARLRTTLGWTKTL